ncbi:type II and III secretion system protein family protein [Lichenicola cladoniae]|uniref:Type II and III secretion system protein family protein n=1 Tax=Lichenicola cladoniae TaxID=1484109 RepID=A0A6M8HJP8_9PROT|nr:type II and III secretion system protein family protein [Lichenicola cladoniae]NPD69201.1 type II and III secretion system protein family protein [Acetobacteraceae bacterium]QKE89028.1 type II and III secretion system protein family protein [Lichenicola cladoniae]
MRCEWTIAVLALACLAAAPPAAARNLQGLSLEAGTGRIVKLLRTAANIFVADPKVVEVRPASAQSLFLFGLKQGHTTVAALDSDGQTVALYDVVVGTNTNDAKVIARSIAASSSDLAGPAGQVTVRPEAGGVTLSGTVPDPIHAERAEVAASLNLPSGEKAVDALNVNSSVTVGLKVRITEMTRQVTRDLGVDWSALGTIGKFALNFATTNGVGSTLKSVYTGKGLSVDTVIEALATDNLVRVLAEPNLTARSGESASFLVGGEYPIPVFQNSGGGNGGISIEYKQFGVSLSFVPTVLSSGRISLHVRPEVSQLATAASAGAITLAEGNGSLSIPALTVRRAETTIELGSGQSFAIAGLLQDSSTQANNFTPGLGEIPILGALFRSDSYQHNQTELVIIVTPYIVGSASDPNMLHDAGGNYAPPNDLERVLLLRQRGRGRPAPIPGDAGFIIR